MKRAIIIASILALALIALLEPTHIIRGVFRREAFFHNRPTSYWRELLRRDGEAEQLSREATAQLAHNSLAIPVLRESLSDSDRNVRWPAIALIQTCGAQSEVVAALRYALDDTDKDVQCLAIYGLGKMGNEAFCATPQLIELRKDSNPAIATSADYSLWEISPDVAAKSTPWQEFSANSLGFTVMMPGRPEETQSAVVTPFGEGVMFQYTLMFGETHFAVVVVEYPNGVSDAFTDKERYDSAAEMKAKLLGGELKRYDRIVINDVSGRETVTEVPDKGRIRERAFLIGNRAYLICITNIPRLPAHPKEEEYFLDSLRITYDPGNKKKQAATTISVTPGDVLESEAGKLRSR